MAVQNLYVRESSDTTSWADKDSSVIFNTFDDAFNAVTTNNSDGAKIHVGKGTFATSKCISAFAKTGTHLIIDGIGGETILTSSYGGSWENLTDDIGLTDWYCMTFKPSVTGSMWCFAGWYESSCNCPWHFYNCVFDCSNVTLTGCFFYLNGPHTADRNRDRQKYFHYCSFIESDSSTSRRLFDGDGAPCPVHANDCAYHTHNSSAAFFNSNSYSVVTNCIASTFNSLYNASPNNEVGVYGGEYSWNSNIRKYTYYDDDKSTILKTSSGDKTTYKHTLLTKEIRWKEVENEDTRTIACYPSPASSSYDALGGTLTKYVKA